jgi:hypothetical protein
LVPLRSVRFISLRFGESCACATLASAAATRTASHLASWIDDKTISRRRNRTKKRHIPNTSLPRIATRAVLSPSIRIKKAT